MEPRISLITLGVDDLERSWRFYGEGLGFPTTWTPDKGVIFFRTGGTILALHGYDDLAKDAGDEFRVPRGKFSGITLAHNVRLKEHVAEVLAQAERAGAIIVKEPQDTFWGGHHGYFSDPDGYLWEVAYGAFPIREDGSLDVP